MKLRLILVLIPVLAITLSSCGDDDPSPAQQAGQTPTPTATPTTSPSPASTVAVSIPQNAMTLGSNAYDPNPVQITPGITVTWTNNDTVPHTVTSMLDNSDPRFWDSGIIPPGGSFSRQFNDEGDFDYFCTLHPAMVGTVMVDRSGGASPTPSPTSTFDDDGFDDNGGDNGGGPGPG